MGYRTEKLSNGNLRVFDVQVMKSLTLTEPHFKNKTIDRSWFDKALANFEVLKRGGKLPYLWDRHNKKDAPAQVIGRLDNLRIDQFGGTDWVFADVIITDPAHQAKFLAGKTPSKSAEFRPDDFYLRGLALLDGHEGHFDYEVPDFVPEGLYDEIKALGVEDHEGALVLCHSKMDTAVSQEIDMTKEELIAAMQEANKPLIARIEKLEGTKALGKDVDEALQEVREQERAAANVKLAKIEREAKIASYSAALSAKTKTSVVLCRKKLESFQSQEAMDVYYDSAMKAREEDVKLGVEREHGDAPDLREEFEAYKARHKQAHGVELSLGFDDYKRLAFEVSPEGLAARNDRHSARGVTPVRSTEEAFA